MRCVAGPAVTATYLPCSIDATDIEATEAQLRVLRNPRYEWVPSAVKGGPLAAIMDTAQEGYTYKSIINPMAIIARQPRFTIPRTVNIVPPPSYLRSRSGFGLWRASSGSRTSMVRLDPQSVGLAERANYEYMSVLKPAFFA